MPLILAIEADKKQASQLTAMVRGRLHAELILGDTAEKALAALGSRVPDLILTSALLSPKDEAALGERLRTLDGAAAHMQTLTTPVLASPSGRLGGGRAGGMLSALRREKAAPAASAGGCDPAVFAEQCREYLERAATERAQLAEQAAAATEERVAEIAADVVAEPADVAERFTHVAAHADAPVDVPAATADVVEDIDIVVHEPASVFARPFYDGDGPASLLAAVAALAAEEDVEHEAAVQAPDPAPQYRFEDLDLSELLEDQARVTVTPQTSVRDDEESMYVYELDPSTLAEFESAVPPLTAALLASADDEPDETFSETELYSPLPFTLRWPMLAMASDLPRPAAIATEPDEIKEWLEIIEALRRDAEQTPRPLVATPPSPESPTDEPAGKRRRRRPNESPMQDEWGFFDPEQCGFQALLAKLEEITDQDDRPAPRA